MDAPYLSDDGFFVLCPYCASALTQTVEAARLAAYKSGSGAAVPCNVCRLDVTRDAPMEDAQIHGRPTKACVHCAHVILEDALYCHGCRKWQSPPFERP